MDRRTLDTHYMDCCLSLPSLAIPLNKFEWPWPYCFLKAEVPQHFRFHAHLFIWPFPQKWPHFCDQKMGKNTKMPFFVANEPMLYLFALHNICLNFGILNICRKLRKLKKMMILICWCMMYNVIKTLILDDFSIIDNPFYTKWERKHHSVEMQTFPICPSIRNPCA